MANVFVSGQPQAEEKRRFLSAYSAAFLYAPDPVLDAMNRQLGLQMRAAREGPALVQQELKESFGELMLALRREGFFPHSDVQASSFRFVSFQWRYRERREREVKQPNGSQTVPATQAAFPTRRRHEH